jgi:predicted metal-dependent peptidase
MKKLLQARTALVLESPFFGALALRLRLQEDASHATGWTDGKSIGYSPAFVEGLTHAEATGFLAHEVMHVASGHPWRRDGRERQRWNKACDYAINGTLQAAGFTLPTGALLSDDFTGKPAEWIYDRLPAEDGEGNGTGSGNGGSGGDPQPGEVRDAPAEDAAAPSEEEWRQAVQQAANVARARGSLPGALDRFAKEAAAPSVNWRSVLARFLQASAKADFSWTRPNVRHLARGLYLPAMRSEEMGRIAVAVDVSGSVDAVLLAQFAAEINAIARELQPEAVDVLYCDARMQKRESFERGEEIQLHACGGGGTDFRPVFEALEDGEPPVALVYLTDLDGRFPVQAPEFPVLWGATSNRAAPFGELVRMV